MKKNYQSSHMKTHLDIKDTITIKKVTFTTVKQDITHQKYVDGYQ